MEGKGEWFLSFFRISYLGSEMVGWLVRCLGGGNTLSYVWFGVWFRLVGWVRGWLVEHMALYSHITHTLSLCLSRYMADDFLGFVWLRSGPVYVACMKRQAGGVMSFFVFPCPFLLCCCGGAVHTYKSGEK
jgi:hypothetical protein